MKSQVVFLVGPPLSGKDTFLRDSLYKNYEIISRDEILLSLHTNNNYSEAFRSVDQKLVDKILNQKIQESVLDKKNVVLNLTNISMKSRLRNLSKFSKSYYDRIAIVFPKLDLDVYYNRNKKRSLQENKFISEKVIKEMVSNWESVNESEGFDTIIKL